jgi:hypothetical protein
LCDNGSCIASASGVGSSMIKFATTKLKKRGWVKLKCDNIKDISEMKIEVIKSLILNDEINQTFQKNKILNINDLWVKSKNLKI